LKELGRIQTDRTSRTILPESIIIAIDCIFPGVNLREDPFRQTPFSMTMVKIGWVNRDSVSDEEIETTLNNLKLPRIVVQSKLQEFLRQSKPSIYRILEEATIKHLQPSGNVTSSLPQVLDPVSIMSVRSRIDQIAEELEEFCEERDDMSTMSDLTDNDNYDPRSEQLIRVYDALHHTANSLGGIHSQLYDIRDQCAERLYRQNGTVETIGIAITE
jgi:hypothetical protein